MALGGTVRLSLTTLLAAMQQARCGDPHPIFAGGGRYIPPAARNKISAEVAEELGGLGLTRGDRLDDEFEDTLHVLDHPDTEYFGHLRSGDEHYGALVAVLGRTAVTALVQDGTVVLEPAKGNNPPLMLTEYLPDYPPADFTPFSVRHDEFTGGGDDPVDDLYDDDRTGLGQAARDLHTIVDQPYYGLGYLHTARRARGAREQATQAISYLDIEVGRVGMELSGPPNNQYINVFPGEPTRLAAKLASLRAALD